MKLAFWGHGGPLKYSVRSSLCKVQGCNLSLNEKCGIWSRNPTGSQACREHSLKVTMPMLHWSRYEPKKSCSKPVSTSSSPVFGLRATRSNACSSKGNTGIGQAQTNASLMALPWLCESERLPVRSCSNRLLNWSHFWHPHPVGGRLLV